MGQPNGGRGSSGGNSDGRMNAREIFKIFILNLLQTSTFKSNNFRVSSDVLFIEQLQVSLDLFAVVDDGSVTDLKNRKRFSASTKKVTCTDSSLVF